MRKRKNYSRGVLVEPILNSPNQPCTRVVWQTVKRWMNEILRLRDRIAIIELTGITPGNKTAWKKLTAFLGGCCCCWLADDDYKNEASNKESVNVVYLVEVIH